MLLQSTWPYISHINWDSKNKTLGSLFLDPCWSPSPQSRFNFVFGPYWQGEIQNNSNMVNCYIICSVFWQHVSFWRLFHYFPSKTCTKREQNKLQISTGRVGFPKFHWASTKSGCPVTSETTEFKSQSTNYSVDCICIQKKSLPTSMTQVACRLRHNKKVWGKLHIVDKSLLGCHLGSFLLKH